MTVSGNFTLSLWAWDVGLKADGANETIRTGPRQPSRAPAGTPDASSVVSEDRETYFFVSNGTLTVPNLTGTGYSLYTGPGTALAAADVRVRGATGQLMLPSGSLGLEGSAIKVTGEVEAVLSGTGTKKPLALQLASNPDAVAVDGRPLSLAVAPKVPAQSWWPYAVAAGVVAVTAYGLLFQVRPLRHYHVAMARNGSVGSLKAVTRRERRGHGFWCLAADATKREAYRVALLYVALSARLFPDSLDAPLLKSLILRRMQRYRKALQVQASIYERMPTRDDRVAMACMAAITCIKINSHEEAIEWLKKGMKEDPLAMHAELGEPSFDALRDHPWLKALHSSSNGHANQAYS